MYRYTLAFIKRNDEVLMINRNKSPWMGSWNGVGGKFNSGETPLECIKREVYEETDIVVDDSMIIDKGFVTWNNDANDEGLYLYLIHVSDDFVYQTPRKTIEGILDWKKISWISSFDNYGVCDNIPYFLNDVINDEKRYNHYCEFEGKVLVQVLKKELKNL
ncbi:MAG: 8-oxo-dGTP diphosphatase [Acholeplasma sp.]|nr:8-oxo-dGTP diphosphatase [Acholeplasma sp.]